jgi:demethylmenaquinone methyltransferase / 2-methoxy-6-polyprenyl-1,4-benzoquinol methylase
MSVVPYKEQKAGKKAQVATMFDQISPKYDFLNHLLSFGIDVYWRKRAIRLLKPYRPDLILDIATGTADFAIEALDVKPKKVIGVDISEGMLKIGREKIQRKKLDHRIELQLGDSEKLLFPDNYFDAVIVSFGVRNFENLESGLRDMYRVLKTGGVCVIVEFSNPTQFPFKQLYNFYSNRILPVVGRTVSRDNAAYRYLPESVKAFPDGKQFLSIFEKAGFTSTTCIPLTFGVTSIYTGRKLPS